MQLVERHLAPYVKSLGAAEAFRSDGQSGRIIIRNDAILEQIVAPHGGWLGIASKVDNSLAKHVEVEGVFSTTDGGSTRIRLAADIDCGGDVTDTLEVESTAPRQQTGEVRKPAPIVNVIAHVSSPQVNEQYVKDEEFWDLVSSGHTSTLLRNRIIRLDDDAINRINRTLMQLAQAELVHRTTASDAQAGHPLVVRFLRNGNEFELKSANHALVSELALLSEVELQFMQPEIAGERLVLLDEPELHLHPRVQADLARILVENATRAKAQVVSVTHSDHILRQLLPRSDHAVLNIERAFSRIRRLHTQRDVLVALSQTHEITPFSAINFLSSRRILFLEGATDDAILVRCAIAHFFNSEKERAAFESWTRICLDGVDNAPAPQLMERLISSKLLPNLRSGEGVVVACAFDRDYGRIPGWHNATGSQVRRCEYIWSRHSIESLFIEVDVLVSLLGNALGTSAPTDLSDRILAAIQ